AHRLDWRAQAFDALEPGIAAAAARARAAVGRDLAGVSGVGLRLGAIGRRSIVIGLETAKRKGECDERRHSKGAGEGKINQAHAARSGALPPGLPAYTGSDPPRKHLSLTRPWFAGTGCSACSPSKG